MVYPVAYSAVLGIIAGAYAPTSVGWGMLGIFALYIGIIVLSGMVTLILFLMRLKSKSMNEFFIPSLKVTLSLIVFTVIFLMFLTWIDIHVRT